MGLAGALAELVDLARGPCELLVTVPDVFTKTPLEGVIQERGFRAQGVIASVLRSTPLLVAGGALAWAYQVYRAIMASTVEGKPPMGVAYRLAGMTGLMALGWVTLGTDTSRALTTGPIDSETLDETWAELPGVASAESYDVGDAPSGTLWGFGMMNGAFEEVSAIMTGAVGGEEEDDPGVLIRDMVKLQATMLGQNQGGQGVMNAFDSLARNCARTGDLETYTLGPGASIEDLFDTRTGSIGTDALGGDVDCASLWTDFEEETQGLANDTFVDMVTGDSGGLAVVTGALGWQRSLEFAYQTWGMEEDEMAQFAANVAIEATLKDAARRSATGINPLRKDEATFSEGWPDYIAEVLTDGVMTEGLLNAGSLFDPNIHLRAQKAEAAKRFNEIADMIPPLRGFLFSAFAVTFPLAAYAMALGFVGPMKRWLTGRFVLAMYMPAARLLHGAAKQFNRYNDIAGNPDYEWLYSDAMVLGALSVMEAETLRVQTAYLLCEVAVFTAFAIGSVRYLGLGGMVAGVGINPWGYATLGGAIGYAGRAVKAQAARVVGGSTAARAGAGAAGAAARTGAAAGPVGAAVGAGVAVATTAVTGRKAARKPPPPMGPPRSF
jgi:hypothetical protein